MTNKKFSIRKLAVGTSSVAIGFFASGSINSILANDYPNNYENTYSLNDNKNNQLSPEEYSLKQAKEKALEEIYKYRHLYIIANWNPIEKTMSDIEKSQSKEEISSLLQEFKNKSEKLLQDKITELKNLTSEDLLELNISAVDELSLYKATILNKLYTLKGLSKDEFKKYKSDIISPKNENGESLDDYRSLLSYLDNIMSVINTKNMVKKIYDSEFISVSLRSKLIDLFFSFNGDRLNPANAEELDTLSYSLNTLEKLSKNNIVSDFKKEELKKELITYLGEGFNTSNYTKAYHLLSVIRSLNEQNESNNKDNIEPKNNENENFPENDLNLSNKKVIAYDFLKGLAYPTLENLRTDIMNATEDNIYLLANKASAIKQIENLITLSNEDKQQHINKILTVNSLEELPSIVGKVLENNMIEISNLDINQKHRLKEKLNTLAPDEFNAFANIIYYSLALKEIEYLSPDEKETFFNEFVDKFTKANDKMFETSYKMDISILINKLSYLTNEDKKIYKEKLFKFAFGGAAWAPKLEFTLGYTSKELILQSHNYTLRAIEDYDIYKEAVSKNENLRKKIERKPTFESKTENINIPFETIYKDDNTLDKGKEVVETEGVDGIKEITRTYTIMNGVRQGNPKIEEKITKEKVNKVIRRGTKEVNTENSKSTVPEVSNNTPNNKPESPSISDSKSTSKSTNVTLKNIDNNISVTLNTKETGITLVTNEITSSTTLSKIKEKIKNENNSITSSSDINNLRVIDLTLEKNGQKYNFTNNRTVRIALLDNEKGKQIRVYHIKDNGELEELTKEKNNLTITNNSVEFTINHFSKFAIASIKKNKPASPTNPGSENNGNNYSKRSLANIKPSETNSNKVLPKTGASSSYTTLLGTILLGLTLINRKLKKIIK